jgi:hypothetical protein
LGINIYRFTSLGPPKRLFGEMYRNAKMRRKYGFGVALCLGICLYKMDL